MAAKRKIPTLAERAADMPPAERKAYLEHYWRDYYLPLLTKEKPERVECFLTSVNQHTDLHNELIFGYDLSVSKEAQDLLLLLGSIGIRLPAHFQYLQETRRVPPECDELATILSSLKVPIEARDAVFFRDIADLLEAEAMAPIPLQELTEQIREAWKEGRKLKLKGTGKKQSHPRSYIRSMVFCLLDICIRCKQCLPTADELFDLLKITLERPPERQAFDNALKALGLASPVLE